MNRSWLSSLRSRLITLVLIAVLPGFSITLFVARRQQQIALESVQEQNLSILRLVALSQSQLIANTRSLMGALALAKELGNHDIQSCQLLLDHTLQNASAYRGFSVSTLQGQVWCLTKNLRSAAITTTTASTNTVNPNAEFYARALAQKDFVIGNFTIGNVTKRPNLNVFQPVYDAQGEAIAMLTAGLDLDNLNQSIGDLKLPPDYVVDVLDRNGTFIVRWPTPQDYVGKTYADAAITQKFLVEGRKGGEFTGDMEGIEGIHRLYASKRVPGVPDNDLFVNVSIAPEVAYANVNNTLREQLAVLGLFTLLALLGAWIFSNVIVTRPITALARAAKEISTGNLNARTHLKSGRDELSLLARDFDQMCDDLQRTSNESAKLNAELEQRVNLRTDQLQKAINKLRESREQLRNLSHQQRAMLEEEQTRISREVHDQIGQALTGMKMDISSLQRYVLVDGDAQKSAINDKIKSISSLIDETIQTVRGIAQRLRPTILDDLGLGAAIEWQGADFQKRTGIVCSVVNHNVLGSLERNVVTAAYRIVQEALTNVVRHAQATEVLIELEVINDVLKVQVRDNGQGIAAEQLGSIKSLGVLGMRERAYELGGTVEMQSSIGKGVVLIASLPTQGVKNQPMEMVNGHL